MQIIRIFAPFLQIYFKNNSPDDYTITIDDVKEYEKDAHFKKKTEINKYDVNYEMLLKLHKKMKKPSVDEKYVQEASVNIKNYDEEGKQVVSSNMLRHSMQRRICINSR